MYKLIYSHQHKYIASNERLHFFLFFCVHNVYKTCQTKQNYCVNRKNPFLCAFLHLNCIKCALRFCLCFVLLYCIISKVILIHKTANVIFLTIKTCCDIMCVNLIEDGIKCNKLFFIIYLFEKVNNIVTSNELIEDVEMSHNF